MNLQSILGYLGVGTEGKRRGDGVTRSNSDAQSSSSGKAFESLRPILEEELQDAMQQVSDNVRPWVNGEFTSVKLLQEAIRNHGCVDLMRNEREGGKLVAVKRMPNRWVREDPKQFDEQYPATSERPWYDLGFVRQLNTRGFPFACELLGVLRDSEETYVVTSLCTEGDLFAWCDRDSVPRPGQDREKHMLPIIAQLLTAVRWLHDLGIAHRDLSLENILLTEDAGHLSVKVIDFGMGTLAQTTRREVRGKQSYQAPEMHLEAEYDTFLADEFAIGVVLFAMAAQDYPWTCTKRNACQLFEYVSMFGFRRFLEKRKLRKGNGEYLIDVFTPAFTEMLEALLQTQPKQRASLGETCLTQEAPGTKARRNVWEMGWLENAGSLGFRLPAMGGAAAAEGPPSERVCGG